MPITVSIVEDDAQTRDGLGLLLNRAEDFRCVSQHATGEDAVERIPSFQPNAVLMDINLPGMSGVEAVRKLKPLLPQTIDRLMPGRTPRTGTQRIGQKR